MRSRVARLAPSQLLASQLLASQLLASLLFASCSEGAPTAAPEPPPPIPATVRFVPNGDVVYAIEGDDGFEDWTFGVDLASGVPIEALQIRHLAGGEARHEVTLRGGALDAFRAGGGEDGYRDLHFDLPAALAIDEVEVTATSDGRTAASGTARVARYAQRGVFRVPLEGCWLVASGHDFGGEHRRHYSRGHFAWDFVRVSPDGVRHTGEDLADHLSFGQPVLAPAGGVVVALESSHPDRPPGDPGPTDDANFVVLDHGHGERSRLVHLRRGSVRVAVGDRVEAGQRLAEVGNSGASDTPHLHLGFERAAVPDDADDESLPIPIRLSGYRLTSSQADGALVAGGRPRRGDFVCGEPAAEP
jgi:murein DD-endopeptidase MepM/ murein hydrolase activator NlpD